MKKIKNFLAAAAVASGFGILTGCSNEAPNEERVTVDLFNIKVETRDQLLDLVEVYEVLHPGVEIRVTTVGGGTDAPAALQARFAAGEAPAIFMLGGLGDITLWQDYLLDVSQTDAAQNALPGTLEGGKLDGVLLGLPYNIEGFGWLFNTEIFEEAGIDPDSIQSFSDFEAAVRLIDSKLDELGLDAVFAFSAAESWVVSQFSSHFSAVNYDSCLTTVGALETFSFGDTEELFQKYIHLIKEFSVEPLVTVDYSTAVEDLFVNGRVAMTHQGNWIIPTLDAIDPTFSQERLGILPLFVKDNGTTGTIAAGPSWFWGINGTLDDEIVEEAINFLNWMYLSEEGKYAMINDFGFIPAYYGNDSADITDPVSRQIYEMLAAGYATPWTQTAYPAGWSPNNFHPQFQRYVAGEGTWEEFMEMTTQTWEEARR